MESQSTTSKTPNWLIWIIVAIFLTVSCWLIATIQHRQIPFDGDKWKLARRTLDVDIRYRMISDLLLRLDGMRGRSFEDVQEMLGTPDVGNAKSRGIRYYVGQKHFGPIPHHGYYLRLVFDDNLELVHAEVVPQ